MTTNAMNVIQYTVDTPSWPEPESGPPRSHLTALPFHIFALICRYIAPLWLYNLSHACRKTFQLLTFQNGNKIWYDSMPSSLWRLAEMYQDEEEIASSKARANVISSVLSGQNPLLQLVNLGGLGPGYGILGQPGRGIPMHGSWDFTYVTPRIGSGQGSASTSRFNQPAHNVSSRPRYWRASRFNRAPTNPLPVNTSYTCNRERVMALGGPYEPFLNYKREIIGHWSNARSCFICLTKKPNLFNSNYHVVWGIVWCEACLKDYSITYAKAVNIVGKAALLHGMSCDSYPLGKTQVYFKPELSQIWKDKHGQTLEYCELAWHNRRVSAFTDRMLWRRGDYNRSQLRLRIVSFAQAIWEGCDPCPDYVSAYGNVVTASLKEDRKNWCCPGRYQAWRERFAPHVRPFLFAEHSTIDVQYNAKWLDDVVLDILVIGAFRGAYALCDSHDLFLNAADLLERLTNWSHRNYSEKGYGGYVSTWVKAANDYHTKRIMANLESGATADMRYIAPVFQDDDRYRQIKEVRIQLKMQTRDERRMQPMATRPDIAQYREESRDKYIEDDQAALKEIAKRQLQIKFFNKIMAANCNTCSESGGVFPLAGIPEFLEHMRKHHPRVFWETDDIDLVG